MTGTIRASPALASQPIAFTPVLSGAVAAPGGGSASQRRSGPGSSPTGSVSGSTVTFQAQASTVLVYAGCFLSEDAGIQKILKDKTAAGARVRILLGSPLHLAVAR